MKISFPYTVETQNGGIVIRSPEHLRQMAKSIAKLSIGFIQTSALEELLPIVVRRIEEQDQAQNMPLH